jgi:hypothetical protein
VRSARIAEPPCQLYPTSATRGPGAPGRIELLFASLAPPRKASYLMAEQPSRQVLDAIATRVLTFLIGVG